MGSLFNCIRVINYYKFCFLSNNLFTATIRRFLCHSYNNPSSLFLRSENSLLRIFLSPTQRHLPSAQHVVPDSAADDTICCVISLTCDASRRGGKQRYDDFLSVVHFRKPVNNRKIGSAGNGPSIITLCFYKSDFNFYWLT